MKIVEEQELTEEITEEKFRGLTPDQKEKLKLAEEEYQKKLNEVESKEYLISGGIELAKKIREWLARDCEWVSGECVGVYKLHDIVADVISKIESGKMKEFYLQPQPLTALHHLLNKVKGVGYQSAKKYKDMIMPVLDVINTSLQRDNEILERLKFKISAASHGVETDESLMAGLEEEQK